MSTWMELDTESLLVRVSATTSVSELEAELGAQGLTLDATTEPGSTVASWLTSGAPGARDPWLDPADHLVAGFTASFGHQTFSLKPAPRRATGPDLFALLFGQHGRVGTLHEVWLRVHRAGVSRPSTGTYSRPDPSWTADEAGLLDRIEAALAGRPR